ncbi:hypothetical protein [Mycobacteroides abscessus]|uniref:hypothetical protein n=1 Tax=Mycobacteroides abscessus TaxID=36809 RepID=UPI000C258376|nr:hypothetical protein [Mycobacteroides abscessus]RIR15176.1 hypothetical protein D2E27_06620 [Mycobacteroides abscessus]RIS07877.1 hypothetical protein D2E58_03950 [Mycobacteroides abscessus]
MSPAEPDDAIAPDGSREVVTRLLAAMVRVLSGQPTTATPGDLTITAVAIESGLKRHHLTHKHVDLKDLFYQLRDHHQNPVKHDADQLRTEIDDLKRRLTEANAQRRKWKATAEAYARAIHLLTVENSQHGNAATRLRAVNATPRTTTPHVAEEDT